MKSVNKYTIDGITITNPTKVIFKNPLVTKYDIAKYYHYVYKRMEPFLKNRVMSTIRCPDGVNGCQFFKKHFDSKDKNLGRIIIKEDNEGKNDYYYIKNIEGLINEVQMNGYEFHLWGCNVKNLEYPDMMIFDLDPFEKLSLEKIRTGVKDLKSILDNLNLKSYLKTSGGKGYHIVIPLNEKIHFTKVRKIAKDIAKLMEVKWPDKYTSNMRMKNRTNKIFIDWVRNTRFSSCVSPYSIRLKKKCSVSMPIKWSELDKVRPNEITIDDAIKRLKRKDPWEGFFN